MHPLLEVIWNKVEYDLKDLRKEAGQLEYYHLQPPDADDFCHVEVIIS